ncbi:hypothetical protein MTO96_006856 [Rhipicephalus appendiculatus]
MLNPGERSPQAVAAAANSCTGGSAAMQPSLGANCLPPSAARLWKRSSFALVISSPLKTQKEAGAVHTGEKVAAKCTQTSSPERRQIVVTTAGYSSRGSSDEEPRFALRRITDNRQRGE